jgi:transposase, IS30 family
LHTEIAAALSMPVYFCEKASPWQRPSNENTNGLLRQYFPKGTNLHHHDADRLAVVADELNTRPRKTLSWQTPDARLADVTVTTRPGRARVSGRRGTRAGSLPGSAGAGSA